MLIQTKKSVTYYSLFFLATNNLWSKSATGHQGPSAVFVRLNTTEAGGRQRVTVRHRAVNWYGTCATATSAPPAVSMATGQHCVSCSHVDSSKLAFLATQANYTNYESTRRECRQWEIHAVFCHVVIEQQTITMPLTFNSWSKVNKTHHAATL